MKRRQFLKAGVGAGAVPLLAPRALLARGSADATVTAVHHPDASTYSGRDDGLGLWDYSVNAALAAQMVDQAVLNYTGAATVGEAWEALLAARGITVTTATKIGLKFNNSWDMGVSGYSDRACPYAPRVETVNAIASGLTQMLGGTFPIENITAFDKRVYNYTGNYDPEGTKLQLQGFPAAGIPYDSNGAGMYRTTLEDTSHTTGEPGDWFDCGVTRMVTQKILQLLLDQDAFINIPMPKVNVGSGTTACMKNTYGLTHDCGLTHDPITGTNAAPGTADCIPVFYKSIDARVPCVLNVLDALAGNYDEQAYGGPSFMPNIVAVSTDPVALDVYATELINGARRANGWHDIQVPPTTADRYAFPSTAAYAYPGTVNEDGYPNAHYLAVAAEEHAVGSLTYTLDYDDLSGRVAPSRMPAMNVPQSRLLQLRRTRSAWELGVLTDRSGRTHTMESRIVDLHGRTVRALPAMRVLGPRTVLSWDGRDDNGHAAGHGTYCWEVRTDGRQFTTAVHH